MCVTSVPELIPTPCSLDVWGNIPVSSCVLQSLRSPVTKTYNVSSRSSSAHSHDRQGPCLYQKTIPATSQINITQTTSPTDHLHCIANLKQRPSTSTQTPSNANFMCLHDKCMQDYVCLFTHLMYDKGRDRARQE